MKAMILAAGRGERMRPLTDRTPKPLLALHGRPLIEHVIARLRAAGIDDLVVNHAWLGSQIVAALEDGRRLGVRIRYSAEPFETLETGGGIRRALPLLGPDPFVVCNADVWCDYDFTRLRQLTPSGCHLVLVANPAHHPNGDFHLNAGRVQADGEPKLTFSGIGLYHPNLFYDWAPGRFPLLHVLRAAIAKNVATGERHGGRWEDVGTPERLQTLEHSLAPH